MADTSEKQQAPKRKPARRQVEAPVTGHEESHAPGTFNLWTGRKLREFRSQEKKPREVSKYRCRPQLDSGWTRGEGMDVSYCCLYFARGLCHHGSDCNYLHRVPTEAHERRHQADYGHDIFGRERGPASRDGRKKGVGSYERECRTLYVHYGGAGPLPVLELRALLEANFGEWGPIEDIHVVPDKTIAFVRYSWRSSAEFAKAAMHQQGLDGSRLGEVLDVRWANDDPNPRAVQRVKREREGAFRDAYLQAVMDLPPEQKQARLAQLNLQANVRPGCTTSAYPDTSAQYGGAYPHDYQGWDQYYYGQQQQQQQQQYESHFYGAHQQYDDMARYLPPEEAWRAAQAGGAGVGDSGGEEEGSIPPEFLEFTPDLVEQEPGGHQQPRQGQGRGQGEQQYQHQQGPPGEPAAEGAEGRTEPAAPAAAAAAEAPKEEGAAAEEENDALGLLGGYGSSGDEGDGGG